MQVRNATPDDQTWIHELRHRVYAEELGQHPLNDERLLVDALDGSNVYLVAADDDGPIGFVSLTPPWVGRFSLDKYLSRDELPVLDEADVFEVRILTVEPGRRSSGVATLLMYAAMRWIAGRGGRTIVAMGRHDLLDLYRGVGLLPTGRVVTSGAVAFEVMTATVADLTALALGPFASVVQQWRDEVDWQVDTPFASRPDGCEHGGASFGAIGTDFRTLERRREVVTADVLDAWFPPSPAAQAALAEDVGWMARSSPPTDAAGVVEAVAAARGLPPECLALGAGSSDLVFRAFTHWLTPQSRVLLVDPGYGEYAHVTERVIGCQVDRFRLSPDDGWRLDPEALATVVTHGQYTLVVVVNPNNPTGRHVPAADLLRAIESTPDRTRWWIDEAYGGYVGLEESLAPHAATHHSLVVCTSMSKMYALSGVRAAFLVAEPTVAERLRLLTPPWQLGLPAQLAAVAALRDTEHYPPLWERTHVLREQLVADLGVLDGVEVESSVANFVCLRLPVDGPSASRFVAQCRLDDVHLRDLSPLSPSYEGRTVRIAVRDEAENARIVAACVHALAVLRPEATANAP